MNHRKFILTSFKKRGLSLSPPALTALLNILKHQPNPVTSAGIIHQILDDIKERLASSFSERSSLVVSVDLITDVVADMTRDGKDVMDEAIQLLDLASGVPKLEFDMMKRRFSLVDDQSLSESQPKRNGGFFGDVDDKVDMLIQRYAMIHQRLLRQEHFKPRLVKSSSGTSTGDETHKITPIEGLLGSSGMKILLGIIVQVEEGQYYLEDPTAQIPIDLSDAEIFSEGFVTEHSICLVEGEMTDGVLTVKRIGQPIYETRDEAIDAIGIQNNDFFGAIPTLSERSKLRREEEKHGDEGMFVLLSDVHLDDVRVLEKLEQLFDGFQDFDPLPVFIFMGDFAGRYPSAVSENANATIMGYFDDLANVICKFPKVSKEGKFILVPGQNDPGIGNILPRPKVPDFFTSSLRSKVKNVHMASNPCRLRYFSKEFVIGRLDVLAKFRGNCIIPPMNVLEAERNEGSDDIRMEGKKIGIEKKESEEESKTVTSSLVNHAIKTMLDQGHLCPLPPSHLPIYWKYDHLMRVYPPPDAIILGDKSAVRFYETYMEDCHVMNPGSFCSDHGFLLFRPIEKKEDGKGFKSNVEFSAID